MLSHIENELNNTGNNGLAQIVLGVRNTLGKDIPFPILGQALSLEEVKVKYIENPNSSECLTQLMRSFWAEASEKSGKITLVSEFPLRSKEIIEGAKQNQMAVFNGVDWVWIEKLVDATNLNTTESQLREKFGKEGRQIIGLETYKTGGEINNLLYGKYFDQGTTWSRVLSNDGRVVFACFNSDGYLDVRSYLGSKSHFEGVGGRFEEVIKKPIN